MGSCKGKQVITTDGAPKAIGPYSAGIKACHFIYTAGQIGLDPATGNLVEGGVTIETRRALDNLKAIVEAGGGDLGKVVKTTVFLKDIADFAAMNSVYAEYFKELPPARSAVQVAALPKGAAVEIEAVVFLPDCGCED